MKDTITYNGKKYKAIKEDIDGDIERLMKRKKELMDKRPVPTNDVARITGRLNALRAKKKKQNESVNEGLNRRVTVKEVRSWLKKLEEFRYR